MVVEDTQTAWEEENVAPDTDQSMASLVVVDGIPHHANSQREAQNVEILVQGQENVEVLVVVFVVWVEVEIFQSDNAQECMATFCYLFETNYNT